jgi:predicted MFS family arabinose efflux permease
VFFLPAERAALRSVVPVEHLSSALTVDQAREFAAELAGPPLGGVLLGLGRALPFLGDAVSYAYSLVAVLLVRTPLRVARDPDRPTGLLREVTDGVAFTWRNPLLRAITLCAAGANTVYTGLSFAVIVVAHRSGASPAGIGLMLAAAGVGGLLGALLAPRLIAAIPPGGLVLGVLWSGALLIPAMAAHPTPALIGPLLAGFTALMPAANAVLISRQMAATPEDMQGRVFTSVLFLSGAGGAVMPVLVGALLGVAGSKAVLLALGGAMAIVAGLSTANRGWRGDDH